MNLQQILLSEDTSNEASEYKLISLNGQYLKVSPLAYEILHLTAQGKTPREISQEINNKLHYSLKPEDIPYLQRKALQQIESITKRGSDEKRKGFLLRAELISPQLVTLLSEKLKIFFTPLFRLLWLPLFIVTIWKVVLPFHIDEITNRDLFLGYLFFVASLLVHELGHSSALLHYNIQPGGIGVTLYLIYPAFYSDVTKTWLLPKRQRIDVDLGGMYLQSYLAVLYSIIYLYTGYTYLQTAVMLIMSTFIINLNPFLKFDGYWLLSDIFDIPNFHTQGIRLLRLLFKCVFNQSKCHWPWSPFITFILLFYDIFAGFVIILIIRYLPAMIKTSVTNLYILLTDCVNSFPCQISTKLLLSSLSSLFLILGLVLYAFYLGRWVVAVLRGGQT